MYHEKISPACSGRNGNHHDPSGNSICSKLKKYSKTEKQKKVEAERNNFLPENLLDKLFFCLFGVWVLRFLSASFIFGNLDRLISFPWDEQRKIAR